MRRASTSSAVRSDRWPRRDWLGAAGALLLAGPAARALAQADEQLVARLRAGRVVVLLRHARTVPGVGDPPGFRAGECATQRNLSDEGRAQAAAIGDWFRRRGLAPAEVRSSAWCRCLDTARLAFGRVAPWPPIDSFFEQAGDPAARLAALRGAAARLPERGFEVWVTHQVNISEATGRGVAMGEAVVADAALQPLGTLAF